jgi:hypothetical protein
MGLFYKLLIMGALGTYALAGLRGWEFSDSERRPLPSSVRHSPGGNRAFWFTGFHGGK